MSIAPYIHGDKSRHRKRRETVALVDALTDAVDPWDGNGDGNEVGNEVGDEDGDEDDNAYGNAYRRSERSRPVVVFPQGDYPEAAPYFSCGCCNDVDQFALAHKDARPRTTERYRAVLRIRLGRRLLPPMRLRSLWMPANDL